MLSHSKVGVLCFDCHGAGKNDPDAFEHEGDFVATLVTPKDCGGCHRQQEDEVSSSYHAAAGEILDSQDAYLAHVAGGEPVAITGCANCHGGVIEIDENSLPIRPGVNTACEKDWYSLPPAEQSRPPHG